MMLPHTGTSYSVFHVRHYVLGRYVKIDPFSFFIFSEDFEWHHSRRACLCFRKAVHMWWLLGVTYFGWYLVINGFIPHINGFIFFTYHPRKQYFRLKLEFTIAIASIFYSREINFLLSARRFIIEGICIIHWNPRSVVSQFVPKEVEKAHRDLLKLSDLHVEYYQSKELPPLPLTHPHPTPSPFPETGMCRSRSPSNLMGSWSKDRFFPGWLPPDVGRASPANQTGKVLINRAWLFRRRMLSSG